jgi:hypothetical protein
MMRSLFTRISPVMMAFALIAVGSFGWPGEASASSPPSIDGESATNVTEHDVTLGAQINPGGAYTAYEFQIDTTGDYLFPKRACPLPLPGSPVCDPLGGDETLPPGLVEPSPEYIAADSGEASVSLDLASIGATLQPATTYHYRVIAFNGDGQNVDGTDQTFTTPPGSGKPSIEGESVAGLSAHDATLNLQIDPNGLATSYEIMITTPACPQGSCMAISVWFVHGELPAASGDQSASIDLAKADVGIWPAHPYSFRIVATNSAGAAEGAGGFTTPEGEEPHEAELGAGTPAEHEQSRGSAGQPADLQPPAGSPVDHSAHMHRRHRRKGHRASRRG